LALSDTAVASEGTLSFFDPWELSLKDPLPVAGVIIVEGSTFLEIQVEKLMVEKQKWVCRRLIIITSNRNPLEGRHN
jgi:hypothetical protein